MQFSVIAPGHGQARRAGLQAGLNIIDWPSKSSDLNLIENLWSIMDDHIHSSLRPKNRHELREAIPKAIEYLLTEKRDIRCWGVTTVRVIIPRRYNKCP